MPPSPYDLAPLLAVALLGALLALGPLAWVMARHRGDRRAGRLRALRVLTLVLTFDLVLFGAFTRLTDSGLGCPDWPGCYGSATPFGAQADIRAAEAAAPSGPVTHPKAWIEMTHRYLATAVGALIVVLAWLAWRARGRGEAAAGAGWATATLAWVCLQGAFGALTVTMKLYPAIVTAHLLGGLGLLALLARQSRVGAVAAAALPPSLRRAGVWLAGLTLLQLTLGGWVSANYAVLACRDFPTCQGEWWPTMDFANGFAWQRELGATRGGAALPFAALTAIHYTHRLGAYVVLAGMAAFAWRLQAVGDARLRPWARGVAALALWQLASGVGNVWFGWPLAAALAHTAGAAAWVVLLAMLLGGPASTQASRAPLAGNRPPRPIRVPRMPVSPPP